MKNRNLNAVDTFSTPSNKGAYLKDNKSNQANLDDKLIDLYAPDPNLTDIPNKDINISIKFSIPSDLIIEEKIRQAAGWCKKKASSFSPRKIARNKRFLIITACLLVFVIGITARGVFQEKPGNKPSGGVQGATTSPNFPVLAPAGYNSAGIRYDSQRKVASYSHTIRGVEVIVSQQALPENFKSDPQAKVSDLARKFNATKEIVAGEVTAFAGKSADGPQSVIFQKNEVLVFIYSPIELDSQSLTSFITEL